MRDITTRLFIPILDKKEDNMPRGGRREGAGRPTGSVSQRGVRLSKQVLSNLELSNQINPLQFLLAVMQDDRQKPNVRMQAAIAAAPYVHPKLASVELKGDEAQPLQVRSDIGQALAALAELARMQHGQTIELLPSEITDA